jgi:hypothetical protein
MMSALPRIAADARTFQIGSFVPEATLYALQQKSSMVVRPA